MAIVKSIDFPLKRFCWSHKANREWGSESPFYFSRVHQFRSPITMYQIDIMARLTFVVIFLTSSRLRQSKSSFEDQKRFSNYPRWTWIIAKSLHLLLHHRFFPSTKSGQAKIDLLFTYIQLATGNLSRLPFIRAIENILTNCLLKLDKNVALDQLDWRWQNKRGARESCSLTLQMLSRVIKNLHADCAKTFPTFADFWSAQKPRWRFGWWIAIRFCFYISSAKTAFARFRCCQGIQPAGHWIIVPAIKYHVICFFRVLLREQKFRSKSALATFHCFREVF